MGDTLDPSKTERAWEELYMTSMLMKKAWEMEVASCGLTLPQALVLHCLETSPEVLTLGELAHMMYREPHGISALVSRMEVEELVTKSRPRGGGQVEVSITKKGRQACRRQAAQGAVKGVTRTLTEKELDTLHTICNKLRAEAVRLIKEMRQTPYDALLD